MYKNQLQELAQRSCFNLPSYACIREGPDHAPRFKASVNFHGEIFEGPSYCPTLRQAEHAAAEVALNNLSTRGTSRSLAARVLDETGVYKNLLQETAHRAGLQLPVYTTVRSGPGHQPVFTCSVELAGMSFNGEPAKTKKQAEKNAAMAAWSALKQMPNLDSLQPKEIESGEEQEQAVVARVLSNFKPKEENKAMRQRDQIRRRRMTCLSQNASGFRHQWRFDDLLLPDSPYSIYPSQRGFSTQIGPKILPPLPSSSSSNMNNKNTNFTSLFPVLPQKEEDAKGKSISKDPHLILKPNQDLSPRLSYERAFSLPYQRTPFNPCLRNSVPRMMESGGVLHGIAPAVNVRSVVPVCAVPPPQARRTEPKSSGVEKTEAGEEVSAATAKLNKLQIL